MNARLGKEEFDCAHLDEKYDCGCGPEGNATSIANGSTATASVTQIDEAEQTHQPVRHKTALPPKGLAPRSSVEENGELGGYEALLSRGFDGQDVGSCACPA